MCHAVFSADSHEETNFISIAQNLINDVITPPVSASNTKLYAVIVSLRLKHQNNNVKTAVNQLLLISKH
jgi:hypothetical protein